MKGQNGALDTIRGAGSLEALYSECEPRHLSPGWVDRDPPILAPEPNTPYQPVHYRYTEVHAALEAAGRLINTELAERRNLIMVNPADTMGFCTTRTVVGAYQMIQPGEVARSHRHTSHALRVIIDSVGTYSVVDGDKHPMESGDIVLTPGWCWHGHGHEGDEPGYWFDGLDVPLTWAIEPMFFEVHPDGFEPVKRVTADSPFRFTGDAVKRMLDTAAEDGSGYFGRRVQLEAPTMPTIGLYVQRLESGQTTRPYRAVENQIFVAMEGAGITRTGDQVFEWSKGDAFAVPIWHPFAHEATSDSMLFSITDEPLMRYALYYRFEGLDSVYPPAHGGSPTGEWRAVKDG